jgi:excisionase family DNA binding protein
MQETITNSTRGALKVSGAARFLDVSIPTLRRLIKKKEIRVIRKLRHLLIPVDELTHWLQSPPNSTNSGESK